jgi:hypothetical protein
MGQKARFSSTVTVAFEACSSMMNKKTIIGKHDFIPYRRVPWGQDIIMGFAGRSPGKFPISWNRPGLIVVEPVSS